MKQTRIFATFVCLFVAFVFFGAVSVGAHPIIVTAAAGWMIMTFFIIVICRICE